MSNSLGLNSSDMDIINEILGSDSGDDLEPLSESSKPVSKTNTKIKTNQERKRKPNPNSNTIKCTQIFVGGTDLKPGITTTSDPHFCSNLFCLSCDHPVIRFENSQWSKDTDYLFMRNNYPEKVQSHLIRSNGYCAYCCQCTFYSENSLRKLSSYSSNWVCLGHSSDDDDEFDI